MSSTPCVQVFMNFIWLVFQFAFDRTKTADIYGHLTIFENTQNIKKYQQNYNYHEE